MRGALPIYMCGARPIYSLCKYQCRSARLARALQYRNDHPLSAHTSEISATYPQMIQIYIYIYMKHISNILQHIRHIFENYSKHIWDMFKIYVRRASNKCVRHTSNTYQIHTSNTHQRNITNIFEKYLKHICGKYFKRIVG